MEACIEALFTIEGENGRKKTIEMIRVLKGAISVSKSRTGEVIYHYNRHEKKALRRQLAKYDRDTRRSKLDIEQQKRDILRKWSLVFGRQRNFCESIRGFDDMLAEAIILRDKLKNEDDESTEIDDEDAEPEITEEEKARLEEEERKKQAIPTIEDPRKRRLPSIAQPAVPCTTTGMLPKINMTSSGLFNSRLESEEEERARLEREAEEERKRKAKELPRFDTEEVKDFLKEQKHMHEDLLTRNALMKIKTQADNDHVFFKYRMKTKLPGSAHSLLYHIEHDRPTEQDMRPLTRQSTRSDTAVGRPATRAEAGTRQTNRPDTRQTARPDTRQTTGTDTSRTAKLDSRQTLGLESRNTAWSEPRGTNTRPKTKHGVKPMMRLPSRQGPRRRQRASTSDVNTVDMIAEHVTTVPLTSRLSQTQSSIPMPRMERSKTVHFS